EVALGPRAAPRAIEAERQPAHTEDLGLLAHERASGALRVLHRHGPSTRLLREERDAAALEEERSSGRQIPSDLPVGGAAAQETGEAAVARLGVGRQLGAAEDRERRASLARR